MIKTILIFTVIFVAGIFVLDYFLSKKRIRITTTLMLVVQGLAIGLPVFLASLYNLANVNTRSRLIFIGIVIIALLPSLGRMWWHTVKKRVTVKETLYLTLAIAGAVFIPIFQPTIWVFGLLAITIIFMVLFFYQRAKYPYLNDSWLVNLVFDAARNFPEKGRYSAKPITIKKGLNKRFIVSPGGFSLMFKDDHVVCRMSKNTHQKLGGPNLESFFSLVVSEIINCEEKIRQSGKN